MSSRADRRGQIAAGFGCVGGMLGLTAGVIQATIGSRIPGWSGDKASPVVLGVVTILLSLAAVGAAMVLRAPARASAGRRAAASIGLLVPAGVCFTTVGRLWFIPGVLLLVALGFALAAGGLAELRPPLITHWTAGLVSILGAFEILMAASAGPTATIVVGVLGGAVLMVTPWLAAHSFTEAAFPLLVGTVPFAFLTWWSLVTPLLAVVALVLGYTVVRRGSGRAPGGAKGPKVPVGGGRSAVPTRTSTGNTAQHG